MSNIDAVQRAALTAGDWDNQMPPIGTTLQQQANTTLSTPEDLAMAMSSLYLPLDTTQEEFRLLHIEPSDVFDSIISSFLLTVSRADKPSYTTLSYEWGEKTITKPVIVNDCEIQVTRNLEAALRRIRQSHSIVVIWVDALCIDQQNIAERNSQVAMMGKIYSETALTYAWLGEDDGSAESAFEFIRNYFGDSSKGIEDIENFALKMSQNIYDDAFFEARDQVMDDLRSGKFDIHMSRFDDISKVSLKKYWFRTWVQQEIMLSPKIMVLNGSAAIPFNLLLVFSLLIFVVRSYVMQRTEPAYEPIGDLLPSHFAGIIQLIMVDVTNFVSIISSLQECVATDPRDHIYGILGIYKGTMDVTVDYDKPVAQVFVDLVRNLVENSKQLILRQFPGTLISSPIENLPSWAPDFRQDSIQYIKQNHAGVHQNGGWEPNIYPASLPYHLRTSGCIIDAIKSTVPFKQPTDAFQILLDFVATNITASHPTGVTFLQALCCNIFEFRSFQDFQTPKSIVEIRSFLHCILRCGMERHMSHPRFDEFAREHNLTHLFEPPPKDIAPSLQFAKITGAIDHLIEPYTGAQDHSAFREMTPQQRMAPFWGTETYPDDFLPDIEWQVPPQDADFPLMLEGAQDWCAGKALITTEQGYTGFATWDASVGDDICIVAGCPWPAVTRPSGDYHEVVGGSFIFGIMDGELFRDGRLTPESQQIFEFI